MFSRLRHELETECHKTCSALRIEVLPYQGEDLTLTHPAARSSELWTCPVLSHSRKPYGQRGWPGCAGQEQLQHMGEG